MASSRHAVHREMLFLSNQRPRDRRRGAGQPHPLFSAAISNVPSHTCWAVAGNAECRSEGVGDLRGILHHDGAILRFTTWGGAERFVGSPMEFAWEMSVDGTFHVIDREEHWWFLDFRPLSDLLPESPPYAATGDHLENELDEWMRTWAPERPLPLASPV